MPSQSRPSSAAPSVPGAGIAVIVAMCAGVLADAPAAAPIGDRFVASEYRHTRRPSTAPARRSTPVPLVAPAHAAQARPAAAVPATAEAAIEQAFAYAYNLDHDEAVSRLEAARAQFPSAAAVPRALAVVTWLNLLYSRGTVLVDEYLGPISRQDVATKPPPPEIASAFQGYLTRALTLAERRVAQAPNDPDGHYELGVAYGLQASWAATIEGRVMGAFGAARRAYNEHERVLVLAPARKDAGLIVGTYRYVIANLSLPVRWMAYMAGFGGGRERGIQMVEEAAAAKNPAQTDARFALVLFYNRDRQYDRALKHLAALRANHPRNRLLWLESGSTLLRAGQLQEADAMLTDGLTRFAGDTRPKMLGEAGLWYFKRGAARVRLRRHGEAQADLQRSLTLDARPWVRARTHLELGKLADLAGDRQAAHAAYDTAIRVATAARDASAIEEAHRLKGAGYKG